MEVGHHWSIELAKLLPDGLQEQLSSGMVKFSTIHLDTLVTLWISMGIVIFFAALAVGKLQLKPSKLQAVFENIVTIFSSLTKDLGKEGRAHTPILMALFLFIITGNLIGQLPWKLLSFLSPNGIAKLHAEFASPTNDINVTAALAITVLVYYIASGVKTKGIGYFKHYFQPVWFMTPFNMLEDIVRPLTLSLRLFANILAGEILIMVLATLVASLTENLAATFFGSFLPLPIMFFELFVAFVQALVFTLLTSAYINGAVAKHH